VTERLVKELQNRHGLEVDGIVGPKTWRALLGLRQLG
jgi:peptidoglycan hydrolase-like protein with peptidoglycan-binding domain